MPPSKRRPVNHRSVHAAEALTGQTTYPVQLSGPLEGKQVHVGRVALHECLTCGHLMPTLLAKPKSTAMSIWASACSADNCTDRLLPPCHCSHRLAANSR